jgi:hypothetical protein
MGGGSLFNLDANARARVARAVSIAKTRAWMPPHAPARCHDRA